MKILHLDSSILGEGSVSRHLSHQIMAKLKAAHPDAEVIYRDLVLEEIPHLSPEILGAGYVAVEAQTPIQQRELARSEVLISELLNADVLALGVPMYNFSIPTQLKAWFDRVLVAGRTFKYSDAGPVGLVTKQAVYIALSRGSNYASAAMQPLDHQEPYLRTLFAFIGLKELHIAAANGLGLGEAAKAKGIAAAEATINSWHF